MEDPRIISALFIFLKMAYYNVLINNIGGYDDDLKWEGYTGGDIVKVYRITPESLGCIKDVFIKGNLELIWERTESKKMTVEEMKQKLEELTGEEIEVTE